MTPEFVFVDFETRSFRDLSGKKGVGSWKYSEDLTTTVLCAGYKIGSGPVEIWAPWWDYLHILRTEKTDEKLQQYHHVTACPELLRAAIARGCFLVAHNVAFERAIWENIMVPRFGWPEVHPDQWMCSMAQAQAYGLPSALDKALDVAKLGVKKGNQKYMRRMMRPRNTWVKKGTGDIWFATQDDYTGLCGYCKQDVVIEVALHNYCKQMTPREMEIWRLDQRINHRGIHIDLPLARGAWKIFDSKRQQGAAQLSDLTDDKVTAPTETDKIVDWVNQTMMSKDAPTLGGIRKQKKSAKANKDLVQVAELDHQKSKLFMPDCTAETVDRLLDSNIPEILRKVLEVRQAVGGAAALKYDACLRYTSNDGILRYILKYWGAHTGRWSSTGPQWHNAVKNKMDVGEAEQLIECIRAAEVEDECYQCLMDFDTDKLITTLVRSVLIPAPGCTFVDLDYSSVEARAAAWLAGEEELLAAFFEDTPIYEQMAAEIFGIPIEQVTKAQRALGKVAILGLGYGMGAAKFYDTCVSWGVRIITRELAEKAVAIYRRKFKRIVRYWYDFEAQILKTIRTGTSRRFGTATITYSKHHKILAYTLPNGRWLHYHRCEVRDGKIQYYGRLPFPRSGYGTVYSWGGKFFENQDQGMCRDYMAHSMRRLDALAGNQVVLTVHDELLNQTRIDMLDQLLPEIIRRTTEKILWMKGFPIGIGYWIGPRFKKD